MSKTQQKPGGGAQAVPKTDGERVAQVRALSNRIKAGDAGARYELRDVLEKDWVLWGQLADLEESTIKLMLNQVAAPTDPMTLELFSLQVEKLKQDLAGPEPSPMETALAGRCALLWLQALLADRSLTAAFDKQYWSLMEMLSQTAERANRKFLAAVRTLAVVRRLALPVLISQTTIERTEQVVIGGTEPPAPLGLEGAAETRR
jgi:hypothetical protein